MNPKTTQFDELSGLLSYKAFFDEFDAALERAKRENCSVSLVLLDIDNFKSINDNFGHPAGDQVIQALAELLRPLGEQGAVVGRIGGDEMAIVWPDVEREQAFLAIERVRAEAEQMAVEYETGAPKVNGITISGGLAAYPIDGRNGTELLRKADQALYRSKVGGRNKIRLAYEERMVPKTTHYTQTQLERLSKLSSERGEGEAELLREGLDDLLTKYGLTELER